MTSPQLFAFEHETSWGTLRLFRSFARHDSKRTLHMISEQKERNFSSRARLDNSPFAGYSKYSCMASGYELIIVEQEFRRNFNRFNVLGPAQRLGENEIKLCVMYSC